MKQDKETMTYELKLRFTLDILNGLAKEDVIKEFDEIIPALMDLKQKGGEISNETLLGIIMCFCECQGKNTIVDLSIVDEEIEDGTKN